MFYRMQIISKLVAKIQEGVLFLPSGLQWSFCVIKVFWTDATHIWTSTGYLFTLAQDLARVYVDWDSSHLFSVLLSLLVHICCHLQLFVKPKRVVDLS